MRKITLLLLVIATASLTGAVAKGKKCEAQKAKYVVLIGSDGFSSDVVRAHSGAFPNIEALMKNGSYTLERRSVLPSSSAVNWASMLMGAGPELHGYTTWGSQVPDLPSRVIGKYGLFPGICGTPFFLRHLLPVPEVLSRTLPETRPDCLPVHSRSHIPVQLLPPAPSFPGILPRFLL